MPREGYRAITLPVRIADRLAEAAEKNNRSLPKQVEHMLDQLYPRVKGGTRRE